METLLTESNCSVSIETVAMECDDVEDLFSSRACFFLSCDLLHQKRKNLDDSSVLVSHGLPASPSSDLTPRTWGVGVGVGVGRVLAKMTRRKPDQGRRSFRESATAGARDGCEGVKEGGGAGEEQDQPQQQEPGPAPDLLRTCSSDPLLLFNMVTSVFDSTPRTHCASRW